MMQCANTDFNIATKVHNIDTHNMHY